MGQVGVDPTMPVAAADLQSAPFADSVLTHKYKTQMQYVAYFEIIKIMCMAVQVFKWSSEPDLNRRPHPLFGNHSVAVSPKRNNLRFIVFSIK